MKLNKLLLCSLFVLTGCNNNGIKTYKELPEVNNEQVKVDEPDDVKDILDLQFINNLGDLQSNNILLLELKKNL